MRRPVAIVRLPRNSRCIGVRYTWGRAKTLTRAYSDRRARGPQEAATWHSPASSRPDAWQMWRTRRAQRRGGAICTHAGCWSAAGSCCSPSSTFACGAPARCSPSTPPISTFSSCRRRSSPPPAIPSRSTASAIRTSIPTPTGRSAACRWRWWLGWRGGWAGWTIRRCGACWRWPPSRSSPSCSAVRCCSPATACYRGRCGDGGA